MGWFALGVIGAFLVALSVLVWRRWVAPWRDAEELVETITDNRKPRRFLLGGNARARRIGLMLEKLFNRQHELIERVHEGEFSVQATLGAMLDGLLVVDEQHRIRMMNPAFRRLFDLDRIEPGGALLDAVREPAVDLAVTETLRSGEPQRQSIRRARSLGDNLEIEVSAVPLREKSDRVRGAVLLFRDITQLHRVEEMRRDFVANVSHELRTPLSIFRGYLETLLENPKQSPGELLRIFEVMEKHSNRLNLLVEDVLSLAQLEQPGTRLSFAEIYLPDFLAAVLRDWERRFEAKLLRSSLDAPPDLPVLCADENRVQEVIYNLLDNAVKYSQPEGRIHLKAERIGDRLRLAISDEGPGIPSRDLPRIFERFYRADKARSRQLGGTGLGLSIVKHIAELHGGSVEAESEPGHGTTISVNLPIRPRDGVTVTET